MDPANALLVNGKFLMPECSIPGGDLADRRRDMRDWMCQKAGKDQSTAVLREYMEFRLSGYPDNAEMMVVCLKASFHDAMLS